MMILARAFNLETMDTNYLKNKYQKEIQELENELRKMDDFLAEKTRELTNIIVKNKKKISKRNNAVD